MSATKPHCRDCVPWQKLREQTGQKSRRYLLIAILLAITCAANVLAPLVYNMWMAEPLSITRLVLQAFAAVVTLIFAYGFLLLAKGEKLYLGQGEDGIIHLHLHPKIPMCMKHMLVLPFGLRHQGQALGTGVSEWEVRTSSQHIWLRDKNGNEIGLTIDCMANDVIPEFLFRALAIPSTNVAQVLLRAAEFHSREIEASAEAQP